jgi:hypothetical protein
MLPRAGDRTWLRNIHKRLKLMLCKIYGSIDDINIDKGEIIKELRLEKGLLWLNAVTKELSIVAGI